MFRKLASILLACSFLVSFTGIRLLVHHCAGCGTSEVVFLGDASACCMNPSDGSVAFLLAGTYNASVGNETDAETDKRASLSCRADTGVISVADMEASLSCCAAAAQSCSLSGQEGCCNFESLYLKADLNLTVEKPLPRVEVPVSDVAVLFPAMLSLSVFASSLLAPNCFIDPPPRLTGRDFVLYSHQLKFC